MAKLKLKKCELKNVVLTHRSSTSPYFILSVNKEPISIETLEEKLSFDFTTLINGLMNAFQDISSQTLNNDIYDIKMKSRDKESNLYRYLLYMLPNLKDATSDELAGKVGLMGTSAGNRCMLYCNFKSNDNKSFDQYDTVLNSFVNGIGEFVKEQGLTDLIKHACIDRDERCRVLPGLLSRIIDDFLPEDVYCYVTIADSNFTIRDVPEPIYTGDKYVLFKKKTEALKNLVKKPKKYKDLLGEQVYDFIKEFNSCYSIFGKFDYEKFKTKVDTYAGDIYFIFSNPLYVKLEKKLKILREHILFGQPIDSVMV
ncbi:MAG: hypothetical protein PHW96_04280 [Candidatus Nanoarchaeia archaeon]|nr:hypothetical protein [Candidatus Nanoarchaeia archaeon]